MVQLFYILLIGRTAPNWGGFVLSNYFAERLNNGKTVIATLIKRRLASPALFLMPINKINYSKEAERKPKKWTV